MSTRAKLPARVASAALLDTNRAYRTGVDEKGTPGEASAVSSRKLHNPDRHRRCPCLWDDRYRRRAIVRLLQSA